HQDRLPVPDTLTHLLADRAARQHGDLAYAFLADGTAIKDRLTYGQLEFAAAVIAGRLRAHGVRSEPVLLLYPPGLEYIAAFFGCLYAGAIAVPAYPPHRNRSLDRLQSVVRDSQARIVLSTPDVAATVERLFAEAPDLRSLRWLITGPDSGVSRQESEPPVPTPD